MTRHMERRALWVGFAAVFIAGYYLVSWLGADIVLGGIGFLGGLFFLIYAYAGSGVSPNTGALYSLMGTAGILFGGLLCLWTIFG